MANQGRVPSTDLEQEIFETRSMKPGGQNYRAYVGPPNQYDFMGATQFRLLTSLGLREEDKLVDLGCGSLRAGRYFIQYLMPDRYVGVEPNDWLWKDALDKEIGRDVVGLKRPQFLTSDDFRLSELPDVSADFVVAQSIYSHTGKDVFETSLKSVARILKPSGQFLFTIITMDDQAANTMALGVQSEGWIYPECVVYAEEDLDPLFQGLGFNLQRLDWYHPRQTWFRATIDENIRLTAEMKLDLGTGRTLFDQRFERR